MQVDHDKIGKKLFSATVIPNRRSMVGMETDSNDVYIRVDLQQKGSYHTLVRALGYGTNEDKAAVR